MRALLVCLLLVPIAAFGDASMGSADPIVVEDVAPDGRWAVACQARAETSHELAPYFIEGKGPGARIEQLLATDRAGRYVALRLGGKLVLVDTVSHQRKTLGPLPESPEVALEQVSIDPLGKKIVFARDGAAIVRDLVSGKERTITLGAAWGARLAPGGTWLLARVVRVDTNHDGKLALPSRHLTLAQAACRAPGGSWGGLGASGDTPVPLVVDTRTGATRDDTVFAEGDALVRRVGGELVIDRGGKATPLVPASCNGRLRWIDLAQETAIVECRAQSQVTNGPTPLTVYRRGEVVASSLSGWSMTRDATITETKRLYVSNDADGVQVFDGKTGRAVTRPETSIAFAGAAVLLLRRSDGALLVLRTDPPTPEPIELSVRLAVRTPQWTPHAIVQGSLVAVDGYLVDLDKGAVRGAYDDEAVAIGADGRVLTKPTQGKPGPLEWRTPR